MPCGGACEDRTSEPSGQDGILRPSHRASRSIPPRCKKKVRGASAGVLLDELVEGVAAGRVVSRVFDLLRAIWSMLDRYQSESPPATRLAPSYTSTAATRLRHGRHRPRASRRGKPSKTMRKAALGWAGRRGSRSPGRRQQYLPVARARRKVNTRAQALLQQQQNAFRDPRHQPAAAR